VLTSFIIVLMMEAVRTYETSVYSKETTRRYIPEGSNHQVLENSCFSFGYIISEARSMQSLTNPHSEKGLDVL
jgi:hypothetical protein